MKKKWKKLLAVLIVFSVSGALVAYARVMRRREVQFGATVTENIVSWEWDPALDNKDNITIPNDGEAHVWLRFKSQVSATENLALYATAYDVTNQTINCYLYDAGENIENMAAWFAAKELPQLENGVWNLDYYQELVISGGPYSNFHDSDASTVENTGTGENVVKVVLTDENAGSGDIGFNTQNLAIYVDNIYIP